MYTLDSTWSQGITGITDHHKSSHWHTKTAGGFDRHFLLDRKEAVKQMELEVRALPPEARQKLQEGMGPL